MSDSYALRNSFGCVAYISFICDCEAIVGGLDAGRGEIRVGEDEVEFASKSWSVYSDFKGKANG